MILGWQELLEKYPHDILSRQYEHVLAKDLPHIVDERIKAIAIRECGEPLVDVAAQKNRRIQMLRTPHAPFLHPDFNSGLPNATKMRKSVYECFERMLTYLDELAPSFGYKAKQVSIRIFEGLRDLQTQSMLFAKKFEEIKAHNPQLSEEDAEKEACKWISPVKNNIPVHSTGAAVDIRLWDEENNDFVDLGTFGAIWGKNERAITFSDDITSAQKQNRYYMLLAAAKAGLTNYLYEYWHFSSGDRYAAFWTGCEARYGSI